MQQRTQCTWKGFWCKDSTKLYCMSKKEHHSNFISQVSWDLTYKDILLPGISVVKFQSNSICSLWFVPFVLIYMWFCQLWADWMSKRKGREYRGTWAMIFFSPKEPSGYFSYPVYGTDIWGLSLKCHLKDTQCLRKSNACNDKSNS